jgi:hypothetical protein
MRESGELRFADIGSMPIWISSHNYLPVFRVSSTIEEVIRVNGNHKQSAESIFHENAERVILVINDRMNMGLGYGLSSVIWLDGFVNDKREALLQEDVAGLVIMFGSFFGECIRQELGGHWQKVNGEWTIAFRDGEAVFPFDSVAKHLENGAEGSLVSFYQSIPCEVCEPELAM